MFYIVPNTFETRKLLSYGFRTLFRKFFIICPNLIKVILDNREEKIRPKTDEIVKSSQVNSSVKSILFLVK